MSQADTPGAPARAADGMTPGEAASAAQQRAEHAAPGQHATSSLWKLTLGSVGVVYGDIGTSPLYAMRESLHAASEGGALGRADVLGVISLLIWALGLIITFKYIVFVMRADNRGEGGTLSLVALVQSALGRRPVWLTLMGMLGVGLFVGDAAITPAISVLSAVEGLSLVTPAFGPYVIPTTIAIIVVLFAFQYRGTGAVSTLFGPVTVVWFLTMASSARSTSATTPRSSRPSTPPMPWATSSTTASRRSSSWARSSWRSRAARRFTPTWATSGARPSGSPGSSSSGPRSC
jgi:K+ transporter